MADENSNVENQNNDAHNDENQNGGSGNDSQKTVPYAAMKEERMKRQALQDKLSKYEADEKLRNDEKLKADGDYQKLLSEKEAEIASLKGSHEKLSTYETRVQERITKDLEKIPEEERALVAELLEGKSILDQSELLPKLLSRFSTSPKNVNPSAGDSQNSNKTQTLELIKTKEAEIVEAGKKGDAMKVMSLRDEINALKEEIK